MDRNLDQGWAITIADIGGAKWLGYGVFQFNILTVYLSWGDDEHVRSLLSYKRERVGDSVGHTINLFYMELEF